MSISLSLSDREPPLPVYLGLMTNAETRKVCARYEAEGVVCPAKLSKKVFTTAAVDNIDHNPSSATAQCAFHGT